MSDYTPSAAAHRIRTRCPDCYGRLDWYSGFGHALDELGEDEVNDLLERSVFFDIDEDSEFEIWKCNRCQASGVLVDY